MKNTEGTEEQVITPDIKPIIELDEKIKAEILNQVEEQGVVIVHCSFSTQLGCGIRIWSSTFLVDKVSGSKSKLLHALNITMAPQWELVKAGTTKRFILIFSSPPKTYDSQDDEDGRAKSATYVAHQFNKTPMGAIDYAHPVDMMRGFIEKD